MEVTKTVYKVAWRFCQDIVDATSSHLTYTYMQNTSTYFCKFVC